MDLEKISKEQMSQRNFDKWTKYNMKITQDVFQKLQQFVPIKNPKGHHRAFRLKKNGQNIGVFSEIPARMNNVLDNDEINLLENGNELNNAGQNIQNQDENLHGGNDANNEGGGNEELGENVEDLNMN